MELCLGTVQFGMDYGVQGGTRPGEKAAGEMISCALEGGIAHFDTASAYGDAEGVLGRFIKRNPARGEKMRLISKLAPEAFSGLPRKEWKGAALRHARESLERLGIPALEAYLFHNAGYVFDGDAVEALCAVCREGLAKKAGVSVYTPQEAMKALEYGEIKALQVPYNVLDRRLDRCGFFEEAGKKGVEVYARSTLLQGLLLMDAEKLPPKMGFAKGCLDRFAGICREYGIPPLKAAVCCVGRHPGIHYTVFGADSREQVSEYISMRNGGIPEEMAKAMRKEFEYVEERVVNPLLWREG